MSGDAAARTDRVMAHMQLLAEIGDLGAQFVMTHGRYWETAIARPKGMRKGRARNCYKNAADRIALNPEWRYVEGYTASYLGPVVAHAWIADAHGRVIETTWPAAGAGYFGVAFTEAALMRAWVLAGWNYCVLGRLKDHATVAAMTALVK